MKSDDELIEILKFDKLLDSCGALRECYDDICPCVLLGRNARSIDVWGIDDGQFGFRHDPEKRTFPTLGEAVRANQRALEDNTLMDDSFNE